MHGPAERIRVNAVAPGILDGGMSASVPDAILTEYKKHCGLSRLGQSEEVARVMVWLATRNTYVSGQTLVLDGGL